MLRTCPWMCKEQFVRSKLCSNICEDQMSRKVASPLSRCCRANFRYFEMERFRRLVLRRENILFLPPSLKLWCTRTISNRSIIFKTIVSQTTANASLQVQSSSPIFLPMARTNISPTGKIIHSWASCSFTRTNPLNNSLCYCI
jgi:hypothetical protein